jgi:glycosyltransferase involved in cell wall biosynthesis
MQPKFTIIYAYRNRDVKRAKLSLLSLKKQSQKNFEVQFIDYGSTENYANQIKTVIDDFSFVTYHYVAHKGLLWNKSKALNYGISKTTTDYIVIADVDVLFASSFIEKIETLANLKQFTLFKIGYLPEEITSANIKKTAFQLLKPKHYGDTFGIGLFPKVALEKVKGLDTFFHFYGSEDEDLNNRLKVAGYQLCRNKESLLLHQWHPRYPQKKKEKLTITPRLSNIQRINQRHFLSHKERKIIVPEQNEYWNECYSKSDYKILKQPDVTLIIDNIKAKIDHFLNYELIAYKGKVVTVIFKEAVYYNTLKYKLKTLLKIQSQPYLSMKQVNDQVLKKIIFEYRNYNYAYIISDDLKEIEFTIDLRNH